MENRGILNCRSWVSVRKYQVVGALVGALSTFAMEALAKLLMREESLVGYLLVIPWWVLTAPTFALYQVAGLDARGLASGDANKMHPATLLLIAAVNAGALTVCATIITHAIRAIKKWKAGR